MTPRILSVSYDDSLLRTREMMLLGKGYEVVSCFGIDETLRHCRKGNFDLFILGHSIPRTDKGQLVENFRRYCTAPIVSLRRNNEEVVPGADYYAQPDPEPLMKLVGKILGKGKGARAHRSGSDQKSIK